MRKVKGTNKELQSSSSRTSSKLASASSKKKVLKATLRKGGSSVKQEKCSDRLTDNQAKQRWIKVAKINLEEAEKRECTFTPSVN